MRDVTHSIGHCLGEITEYSIFSPWHLHSLLLPLGSNLIIIDFDPPIGLICEVLDDFEHADFSDCQSGSSPVSFSLSIFRLKDNWKMSTSMADRKAEARELDFARR